MKSIDNFWNTEIHPITGFYIGSPGGGEGNGKQNIKRMNRKKEDTRTRWTMSA